MADFVLALDQGTTSSRAIVFDSTYKIRGIGRCEFPQYFPRPGWVEHDPEDLWHTVLQTARAAIADASLAASDIAAISIWRLDHRFEPTMVDDVRTRALAGWRLAVERTIWNTR